MPDNEKKEGNSDNTLSTVQTGANLPLKAKVKESPRGKESEESGFSAVSLEFL